MKCQALLGGVWEEKEKEGGREGSREEGGERVGLSITHSCFTWPFLSRTTWQNSGEVESEDRKKGEREGGDSKGQCG